MFAAAAGGLFAERDLDVELLDGRGSTTEQIASGDAEFGLTAVVYYLRAQAAHRQPLAARFVMAFHQRDPIAGLVRDDSAVRSPADLAGARAARWQLSWMVPAYAAALEGLGLDPPVVVDVEGDPSAALRDGTVDVVPTWADTVPVRSYGGVAVRAVPVGAKPTPADWPPPTGSTTTSSRGSGRRSAPGSRCSDSSPPSVSGRSGTTTPTSRWPTCGTTGTCSCPTPSPAPPSSREPWTSPGGGPPWTT